jgi:hypothetical protein
METLPLLRPSPCQCLPHETTRAGGSTARATDGRNPFVFGRTYGGHVMGTECSRLDFSEAPFCLAIVLSRRLDLEGLLYCLMKMGMGTLLG